MGGTGQLQMLLTHATRVFRCLMAIPVHFKIVGGGQLPPPPAPPRPSCSYPSEVVWHTVSDG